MSGPSQQLAAVTLSNLFRATRTSLNLEEPHELGVFDAVTAEALAQGPAGSTDQNVFERLGRPDGRISGLVDDIAAEGGR